MQNIKLIKNKIKNTTLKKKSLSSNLSKQSKLERKNFKHKDLHKLNTVSTASNQSKLQKKDLNKNNSYKIKKNSDLDIKSTYSNHFFKLNKVLLNKKNIDESKLTILSKNERGLYDFLCNSKQNLINNIFKKGLNAAGITELSTKFDDNISKIEFNSMKDKKRNLLSTQVKGILSLNEDKTVNLFSNNFDSIKQKKEYNKNVKI
jgi:hypothetical protein